MIPRFPTFTPIKMADRDEVEAFIRAFPPYSDFNFLNLFCWNTQGMHALSWHLGNLVVRFSDYSSGTPFYSFLGISSVCETAYDILALSAREGLEPVLRLVPKTTVFAGGSMLQKSFLVKEDTDNQDYILDIREFLGLKGRIYKNKRRYITAFRKRHPGAQLETLDPTDQGVRRALWAAWECWDSSHETARRCNLERSAFARTLDHAAEFNIRAVGLIIDGKLAGFNINEAVHNGYSMGHFGKTDRKEDGMSDLLEHESASIMGLLGHTYVNIQQDLGLPGMRMYKRSLRPSRYLHKYTLAPLGVR